MTAPLAGLSDETRFGKALDIPLFRRFFRYALPYRRWLMLALLLIPLAALTQLAQPLVIRIAVDRFFIPGTLEDFPWLLALFAMLVILQFIIGYAQSVVNALLGQRIVRDLRSDLFRHLLHQDAAFHTRNASGRLTNRLTNDCQAVNQMVSAGMINLVGDIVLLVGIGISMVLLSAHLSLVTLIAFPVIILLTIRIAQRMRRVQRRSRVLQANMSSRLTEQIEGRDIIRIFNQQKSTANTFDRTNREYLGTTIESTFLEALQFSFVESASTIVIALLLIYGAYLKGGGPEEVILTTGSLPVSDGLWDYLFASSGNVITGEKALTTGTIIAFIDYIRRLFTPVRDLSAKFTTMQAAMTALERIFTILDEKPTIITECSTKNAHKTPHTLTDTHHNLPDNRLITIDNISFDYGAEPILKNISLAIHQGERLALVGPSGAGKSTLIKLLNRTIDPTNGSIQLAGNNLKSYPLNTLRSYIGIVPQETFLFAGSITQNITLGHQDIDAGQIQKAIDNAHARDLIQRLKGGVDFQLTERGSNLSSGERQLIGLARAMAFNPPIIIMDEATSHVDAHSQRLMMAALEQLLIGRTAIIVAHRLATVRNADRIVVLSKGEIAEEGSHEQLMAQEGLYAKLVKLQLLAD